MGTDEGPRGAGPPYTPAEMMATVAARELGDGEVVFVGIGLPNLACNLLRDSTSTRIATLCMAVDSPIKSDAPAAS